VIGETHGQDGTRSEQRAWLVLPEKGMYTGVLITGATGSAKTSAAQYPFTAQLIHVHAKDAERKMGISRAQTARGIEEMVRIRGRVRSRRQDVIVAGPLDGSGGPIPGASVQAKHVDVTSMRTHRGSAGLRMAPEAGARTSAGDRMA
jgi:hypothetical protein